MESIESKMELDKEYLKREQLKNSTAVLKQTEKYAHMIRDLEEKIKEVTKFKEFSSFRLESFHNSLNSSNQQLMEQMSALCTVESKVKLIADRVDRLFENELYTLQKNKIAYLIDKNSKLVKAM